MKSLYSILAVVVATTAMSGVALAGENARAKILVHIGPPVTKNACVAVPTDCRQAVVSAPTNAFYYAYVCVANHSDSVGVAGLQFGIQYNDAPNQGVDIFAWHLCSDLEFAMSNWPANNSGNLMTWIPETHCQLGPGMAVAGYFYIGAYTPDRFAIIPRPVDGRAKVADCNAAEDDITDYSPSALGFVDFGTGSGYNPCLADVPVEATTWSGVKSLFR